MAHDKLNPRLLYIGLIYSSSCVILCPVNTVWPDLNNAFVARVVLIIAHMLPIGNRIRQIIASIHDILI